MLKRILQLVDRDKALLWLALGILATVAWVWLDQSWLACASMIGASCSQMMALARKNAEGERTTNEASRNIEFSLIAAAGIASFVSVSTVVVVELIIRGANSNTAWVTILTAAGLATVLGTIYAVGAVRHWRK